MPSFPSILRACLLAVLACALVASARASAPQLADASAPRPKSAAGACSTLELVVFRAYPESDGYSSIVRDVGPSHRKAVERRLPFKVHFNELGQHNLLVAFRGRRPVGLVYQRTEESDWGLVDIAWHVSLDLRVYGFEVTRGLGRDAKEIADSVFAEKLAGSTFDEVCARLAAQQEAMAKGPSAPSEHLARTVLRSAAKALAVTSTVWDREIEKLREAWFRAPTLEEQKAICQRIQEVAFEEVPYIPLGQWSQPTAFRAALTGIVPATTHVFWGVRRA